MALKRREDELEWDNNILLIPGDEVKILIGQIKIELKTHAITAALCPRDTKN